MQPTFLPWAGYIKMIELSDLFIFLDDVQFEKRSFPNEINYSPIFDIVSFDSKNQKTNLIMGGNQYLVKPQFGRYDASKGWVFNIENTSNDKIHFRNLRSLNIEGQIRKFGIIETQNKKILTTAINDQEFRFFEIENDYK